MRKLKFNTILLFPLVILLAGSCNKPGTTILISKIYNDNFHEWLNKSGKELELKDMYPVGKDSIEYFLSQAGGIIISGGPDVNPALYGSENEIYKCEEIDYRRDTLEIRMIKYAMENRIPLLCICRGMQILNVSNGGTLVLDIPTDFDTIIRHRGGTSSHRVNIVEGSLLSSFCHTAGDSVNSYHHQAVRDIALSFRAVAFAEDGLIEAMELKDTAGRSFVLGVQWHPEGMDYSHPLSVTIADKFIDEAIKKARLK
jgi:putative glutamine amidotransferase